MAQRTDEQYIRELEEFKQQEEIKQRYKTVHGLSEKYAKLAADAELGGNMSQLQKVFQLAKAEEDRRKAAAVSKDQGSSRQDELDKAFLQGFLHPDTPPHKMSDAEHKKLENEIEHAMGLDDPFVKGWNEAY